MPRNEFCNTELKTLVKNLPHDLAIDPTRDERSRQEFVASLRHHSIDKMSYGMRDRYENVVKPAFEKEHGRAPQDGEEVHDAMLGDSYFGFYSTVRYNAQQMAHSSVIPVIERGMDELNARAKDLRDNKMPEGGSVTLNDDVEVPRSVANIDVHLTPGSYHSEYSEGEDCIAGAVYDNFLNVFAFGQMGKYFSDIGESFSNYVKTVHPEFKPEKILDCGCSVGHNTLPWAKNFPDAEVTGIDVAPGLMRYASARAASLEIPTNFVQMDATKLDIEDESVDVVFSSMFLHELPLKDIRKYMKEAFRVLKPGGLLLTMELPANEKMGPYESFYLDWDCFYNKEPYYKPFRDQDYTKLVTDAGFPKDAFFELELPRFTMTPYESFAAQAKQGPIFDNNSGRFSDEVRWYGFGVWKNA